MTRVVAVRRLGKTFPHAGKNKPVLRDIHLQVAQGEIVAGGVNGSKCMSADAAHRPRAEQPDADAREVLSVVGEVGRWAARSVRGGATKCATTMAWRCGAR